MGGGDDKGHQVYHDGGHDQAEDQVEFFLGMHGAAFG
jgi:hypothetical protein